MVLGVCAECGFDPATTTPTTVAVQLRKAVDDLSRRVLGDVVPSARLRQCGVGLAWSPVEYIGHLRDVMALFAERVRVVISTDRPDLPVIDHDKLVERNDYQAQDANMLVLDLVRRADELCRVLDAVPADGWMRVGLRAGQERSVLETAQRGVHEARHHTGDIERLLARSGRDSQIYHTSGEDNICSV